MNFQQEMAKLARHEDQFRKLQEKQQLERRHYKDPATHVEFARAMEYKKIADELLQEWHDWSARYRPALGVPGCSPSSREAQSARQYQSSYEIGDESIRKSEMENVEWCVDAIPLNCRQAIGVEMKNRAARARVWRCPGAATYDEALEVVLPVMKRRGLFD